ncbi:MAG: hypothetical protein QOE93_375, partial [Actinomycetota bacterium]|nr:hypothetical protein [Actinomycetota bacterium]
RWYLSALFPAERLRFLHPDEISAEGPDQFDLAVSISSLAEMTPEQVRHYLDLFDRIMAGGIVYLKQWTSWPNPEDGVTMTFDRYPIPTSWRLLLKETAPVQTAFTQAAWAVPGPPPGRAGTSPSG